MLKLFLSRIFSQYISIFLILCLWFNSSSVYAAEIITNSNSESNNSLLITECKDINKNSTIRPTLKNIVEKSLINNSQEKSNIVESTIDKEWKNLDIDNKIDQAIDKAINKLKKDESWTDKLSSNFNKEKTNKYVTEVVKSAFSSDKILTTSLKSLSDNIAPILLAEINNSIIESTEKGIKCLSTYFGKKYPEIIKDAFSQKANIDTKDFDVSKLDQITQNFITSEKFATGGIALIIGVQIIKRLNNQLLTRILAGVGERALGRIGAFGVPIIGEIVATGLILIDAFNATTEGALSEIRKQLKKPEVKDAIKLQIVEIVNNLIAENNTTLINEISNEIYNKYQEFLADYEKVLTLADKSPEFKEFIDKNTKIEGGNETDISELDQIVNFTKKFSQKMSEDSIIQALKDGTLQKVFSLSLDDKYWIIVSEKGLKYLIDYSELLNNKLDKVVELEIYKSIKPELSNKYILEEILSISDDEIIKNIIKLDIPSIQTLLKIPQEDLILISRNKNSDYLSNLTNYLNQATEDDDKKLIRVLLNDDQTVTKISILQDLVNSSNIKESFNFWSNILKTNLVNFSNDVPSKYLLKLGEYLDNLNQEDDRKLINLLLNDSEIITTKFVLKDLVKSSNIKQSLTFWKIILPSQLLNISSDLNLEYLSKLGEYLDNLNQEDDRKLINLLLNDSEIITTKFVLKDLVKSNNVKQSLNFWKIILPSQLLNIFPDLNLEYLSELELSLNQQTEDYQEKLIDLLINTPKNLSIIFILNDLKKSQNIIDSLSFWQKTYNSELLTFSSDFELDKLSDLQQYLYKLTQDDSKKFVSFLVNYPQLLNDKTILQEMVKSDDIQLAINFWKKNNSWFGIFPALPPIKALLQGKISLGFILSKYNISPFFVLIIGIIILIILSIILTFSLKNISLLLSIILLPLKIFKKKEKSDVN